jgi:hypothetical protein
MTNKRETSALSDPLSFEAVLDRTCDRLWNVKVQYSIRRLQEMEHNLDVLEQELEAMIDQKNY